MRVTTLLVVAMDSVGHAHQFYQGYGLPGSALDILGVPDPSGVRLRRFATHVSIGALVVALAACQGSPSSSAGSSTTPPITAVTPGSPTSSPTPPAVPDTPPPTSGVASATCVNGWVTPPANTRRFTDPLGIIRRTTGVKGPLVVVDMRYFVGPESPSSTQGYLLEVERWYIQLYAKDNITFQGRFLVEARRFGRGVAAVAPYDTIGFRSPDWIGFQYRSEDTATKAYPGLPGQWYGTPYDFVGGGVGLKFSGLPDEVSGCLNGT